MVYADIDGPVLVEATHWLWAPGDHWYAMPEIDPSEWAAAKRITFTVWMKQPIANFPESGWLHYRDPDGNPQHRRLTSTPSNRYSKDLHQILDDETAAEVLSKFVLMPRSFLPIAERVDDAGAIQAGSAIYPVTMDTDVLRMMAGAQLSVADFIDSLGEELP